MNARGLKLEAGTLGILDGLRGLKTVFQGEFCNAKIQRCQVHIVRNVLCKVSHGKKKEVAYSLRDNFYAASRPTAKEKFNLFYEKYNDIFPSAIKLLTSTIQQVHDEILCWLRAKNYHK